MTSDRKDPHIVVVVGTRPEVLKLIPVIDALKEQRGVQSTLVFTGQHDSLVSDTIHGMTFDPDVSLNLMSQDQSLYDLVNKCMLQLKEIVQDLRPQCIMVQGDTATAFAASMVAFMEGIPLAHVEAGLRSHNKKEPFPEEGYRRLIDVLANFHFAPTGMSAQNLRREGVPKENIYITGNTIVDALNTIVPQCRTVQNPELSSLLEKSQSKLVLLTAHRRESFGEPLDNIFEAVKNLTLMDPEVEIIYPVHPNPNVSERSKDLRNHDRIHLLDPLSYEDLLLTLQHVHLVLTDSGGIQEEAPSFGLHTIVLRNNTERQEGVAAGIATIVGTDKELITSTALQKLNAYQPVSEVFDVSVNPYGDGKASRRIADIVASKLTGSPRSTRDWCGP